MKNVLVALFILLSFIVPGNSQQTDYPFLTKKQLGTLYSKMITEIEQLDAEGIEVRNRAKAVNWTSYKEYHKTRFTKTQSFAELKSAFDAFGAGFVSGHSDFEFLYPAKIDTLQTTLKSNLELGYTFPNVQFFDLRTKKNITSINSTPIKQVFDDFVNYQTTSTAINDCQRAFKKKFENGTLAIHGQKPRLVTLADGTKKTVVYHSEQGQQNKYGTIVSRISIQGKYKNWKKIALGYKVAVLQRDSIALVKIKDFVYFKGHGGGLRCGEPAKDSTECADVQRIRSALHKISNETSILIIDLQGNFGGQENTRFMAELCPNPFYDMRVQYKKTKLLDNKALRTQLFYGAPEGENWYQELYNSQIYSETAMGDFLPIRADFCRGDPACQLVPIIPNVSAVKNFDRILLLVNEETASSADDFAFRMHEYGSAFIAGQPQAADLTYALVSVLFYLTEAGNIEQKYLGNRQKMDEVNGLELFRFSVPYSKTVAKNGQLLQGNPLPLDLEVSLTKDNFEHREEAVLNKSIMKLLTKK